VPQRGFLLGIPLAAIVFTQWWAAMHSNEEVKSKKVKGKKEERREKKLRTNAPVKKGAELHGEGSSFLLLPFYFYLQRSGCSLPAWLPGLLPLVHAHSFIVVMGIGACLALINWSRWREWLAFFCDGVANRRAAVVNGQPMAAGQHARVYWLAVRLGQRQCQLLLVLVQEHRPFIPLLIAALLWKREDYLVSRRLLFFFLPFTLCFIVPNMGSWRRGFGTT